MSALTRVIAWPGQRLLVLLVAALVYGADQISKLAVTEHLGPDAGYRQVQLLGDYLRLTYLTNSGAAFGMFPEATLVFSIIAILAVPVLFWMQGKLLRNNWSAQIGLGLLLGGNLGNLTDRLRLGYVVDFIDAGINGLRWYVFNVADAATVVGIAIIAFYLIFYAEGTAASRDA